jgi:hypothetical protein
MILVILLVILIAGCAAGESAQNKAPGTVPAGTAGGTPLPASGTALPEWTKEPGTRIADGVSPATIRKGSGFLMYYPGPGGILIARSADGIAFEQAGVSVREQGPGTIQEMVSNPAIIQLTNGTYRMIYEGQDARRDRRLFSAVSPDGLQWAGEPGIRFADKGDGPGLFTSVPDIIRLRNGDLRMYYTRGITSATAISRDDGLTWTKEADLDLGRIVLDPDVVVPGDGTFVMFFTSFDREFGSGPQYVLSARSSDGLHFTIDPGKRLEPSTRDGMVVDPDVVSLGAGRYRMYYGESPAGEPKFSIFSAVGNA